jgi:hypothetical protein
MTATGPDRASNANGRRSSAGAGWQGKDGQLRRDGAGLAASSSCGEVSPINTTCRAVVGSAGTAPPTIAAAMPDEESGPNQAEAAGGETTGRAAISGGWREMSMGGAPLKLAMDRRGCRTYQGGMRVQRDHDSSARDKYRPDVLVRCGAYENATYVIDPIVIVEVLSPSTIDNDRGRKLRFYKSMPTAMHIVLAYSDQMRVEHYSRAPDGWQLGVLISPAETLSLDAVDFSIDLGRILFASSGESVGSLRL